LLVFDLRLELKKVGTVLFDIVLDELISLELHITLISDGILLVVYLQNLHVLVVNLLSSFDAMKGFECLSIIGEEVIVFQSSALDVIDKSQDG